MSGSKNLDYLLREASPLLDSDSYVLAAFYHDHIFVPMADTDRAMSALAALAE